MEYVRTEVTATQQSVKILEDRCKELTNLAQKQLTQNEQQMALMREMKKQLDEQSGESQ